MAIERRARTVRRTPTRCDRAGALALVPVAAIALLLGLWPAPILSLVSESAKDFSEELGTR